MAAELRDALAGVAAAVSVLSTSARDGFRGLTATTFVPLSLEPPLVAVALERPGRFLEALELAGRFNASVLERRQEFVADRFAGRAPAPDPGWQDVPHELAPGGLPIVAGSIAWFECSLEALIPVGDHDLAVGRVARFGRGPGDPLLLWDRSFWTAG